MYNLPIRHYNRIYQKTVNKENEMNLPQSSELNIGYFSRLFDNTTNCYKFFWFKGILKNLEDGKSRIAFDDILN